MDSLPPIRPLIAFEVLSRVASFAKAAEELNLTPSAVSHQIANLEEYVGRRLFERSSHGVTLTQAGQRFKDALAGALASIASAAEMARADAGVETLRLHATPSFATLWLMPRLPDFLKLFPDIRLHLTASNAESDFSRGEVDVDIRYGAIRWRNLQVETLFPEEVMPLASPTLTRALEIRKPEDLLRTSLILSDVNVVQWPQWFAANGVAVSPSEYPMKFDRAYLAIDAAAKGLGIALESNRLAEDHLKHGSLVPVFPDRKGIRVHAHHLVYPRQQGKKPKVASFVTWIRKHARG